MESGYPSTSVAGAVIATIFFPVISLIAAFFLLGRERDPRKRATLRRWAWASGVWLVVPVVLLVVLASVTFGSSSHSGVDENGSCVGGPKLLGESSNVTGSTNKFVVPCAISGTETITTPLRVRTH
jgi:heme/copper-type cytochrome/quinol oxidase subunit 2